MSDRHSDNYSIDDIINGIKQEREAKAGVSSAGKSSHSDSDYAGNRQKSEDDLVSSYLPPQERTRRVATEASQKTRVAEPPRGRRVEPPLESRRSGENEYDGQLSIDGFDDGSLSPRKVSEQQAEKELVSRRRQRIDRFRMFSESIDDEALLQKEQRERRRGAARPTLVENVDPREGVGLFEAVDGVGNRKKRSSGSFSIADSPAETAERKAQQQTENKTALNVKNLKKQLVQLKKRNTYSSMIIGCLFAVMLILAILPSLYTKDGALESFLGGSGRGYLSINLCLMLCAAFFAFDAVRSSIRSIIKLSPNSDAAVLVALLFALLHNVVMLIKGDFMSSGGVLYDCAAVFLVLLSSVSRYLNVTRTLGNLKTIVKNRKLSSVMAIENRADANQLAYGLSLNGNPSILYCADSNIPDDFFEMSTCRKGEEKFFGYAVPAVLILGAIVGIIGAFSTKNVVGFITSFTGCLCMCLPGCITFLSNVLIYRSNSVANKSGGVVLGFDGIADIDKTNAVIVDTKDLFYAEISGFRNIKTYYKMSIEDAVRYAGAVLAKGNGVLASVFVDIARQYEINLPAVEDLRYEDRLGFSAWVNGLRVLVGNEDMMIQHNISMNGVPPKQEGERLGKSSMFVAVEGKLAAAFDVSYNMGKNTAKQIRRLTDNGVVLMVMTRDCAVTEQMIARCAKVNADLIKIAASKSWDIMRMYRNNSGIRRRQSSILFRPGVGSQLKVTNSVFRLVDADRQAFLIQFAGLIFGAGLCMAMNLLNTSTIMNSVFVVVYQTMWLAISFFIANSKLKN